MDKKETIEQLQEFRIGSLPDGSVALLLAYAETDENLARRYFHSFAIGMSHKQAEALATALLGVAAPLATPAS